MSERRTPATVAFVHRGHNWIRGSEQCLLDLVARVDRARFRPVVICEQPTLAREAAALGVHVDQLDPADDWGVLVPGARGKVRAQVRDLFRRHGVALVHSNVSAVVPTILPLVRADRLPLLVHLHLPVTDRYKRLRELVHQADVVVGVADHVVQPLRDDGMPADRLRVIYNAVDAERLEAGDATGLRAALGIPRDAFVAGAVGSVIHRKGFDVTIRAVGRARAAGADVRLVLCGAGDEEEGLRALVAELGLGDVVHLLGFRTDAGAVLRDAADVCVTSAREEALPLNVLEAQWLGLPVVASDIPAHREALAGGGPGVLVPAEDPDALARALVALAGDPARRAELGAAGRQVARASFTMDRYVAEFEALYAGLLARPRGDFGWVRGTSWPRAYTAWVARGVRNQLRLGRTAAS